MAPDNAEGHGRRSVTFIAAATSRVAVREARVEGSSEVETGGATPKT
jgi:hypothetical protein